MDITQQEEQVKHEADLAADLYFKKKENLPAEEDIKNAADQDADLYLKIAQEKQPGLFKKVLSGIDYLAPAFGLRPEAKPESGIIEEFRKQKALTHAPKTPVIRPQTAGEKEFQEKYGTLYAAATAPPAKKEIYGIFENPKVNYYAQKLSQRQYAPFWLTGFAAPGFLAAYVGLQQLPNITMAIKEKSKYDPLADRHFADLFSEDTPKWLRYAATYGEEGARLILSALAGGALSKTLFDKNINKILAMGEEAGYPKAYLEDIRAKIYTNTNPQDLRGEIERLIKIRKTTMPIARRMGVPETYVKPEAPALIPEKAAPIRLGKGEVSATVETPQTTERIINIKPQPDGSIDVKIKNPPQVTPAAVTPSLTTEAGFKEAYRKMAFPLDFTVEKMNEQQKGWIKELEEENKPQAVPGFEELMKERRIAKAEEVAKETELPEKPREINIKNVTGIRSKDFKIKTKKIIPQIVKAHNEYGGSTFNIYTGNKGNTKGYSVGIYPERTEYINGKIITGKQVEKFIDEHAELFKDPRLHVGTYYDKAKDKSILDIVVVTRNRSKAIRLGKKYGQESGWDLFKNTDVPMGGTGEVPANIKKEPLDERLRIKGGKKIILYHYTKNLNTPSAAIDPHAMGTGEVGQEKRQFKESGELKKGYFSKSNWYSPEAKTIEPHRWVGATLYTTKVPTSELLYIHKPLEESPDVAAAKANKIGWYRPEYGQARLLIPIEAKRVGTATFKKSDRVAGKDVPFYVKATPPKPSSVEALSKKIEEEGVGGLSEKELALLKKKGILKIYKPTEETGMYEKTIPREEFGQPTIQKSENLVDVYAKTPLGKTEKVETIPEKMVNEIKEYAEKKKIGDLISFGKPKKTKWSNYLSPTQTRDYVKGYIRSLPRVPGGTSEEEAWKAWEAKTKEAELGKIGDEEEAIGKLEEKVKEEPEDITQKDLPFDGVTKKSLTNFTIVTHKAATRRAIRAAQMIDDAIAGIKMRKPMVIKKALDAAGMTLDDEIMYNIEERYAQKLASTAKGYVSKIIERMKKAGVRDEIINSAKVMDRYPIAKIIKVKREASGIQTAVIPKDLIEYIKEHYRGKIGKKFMRKKSISFITKQGKKIVRGYEVPQQFFKHIGLKEILYDPQRQGERNGKDLFDKELSKVKNIFKNLDKAERKQLFDFFASKQRRTNAMEKAGIKIPKLSDLNMKQQLAVVKWRRWYKKFEPELQGLAKYLGLDIEFFKNYFPLYTKKGIVEVEGNTGYPGGIRKAPFFKSFIERTSDVPYNLYERDVYKNALAYLGGMSKALTAGKRTVALKYLIDSTEFKDIINKDDYAEILDWYRSLVGSTQPLQGARKAVADVARALRRMSTRAILANPRVVLKQGLSFLDVALLEHNNWLVPDDVKQLVRRLSRPTISERVPEKTMVDMRSKTDRALLGAITVADKVFAHGGYSGMLGAELTKMKKEGIVFDNKILRKAVRRVSDRIDLIMGGYTPAQTPHYFRTELGKAINMFISTINSRFQYYIENTVEGIKKKDAFHVAKTITAFFLGAYLEASITRFALNWHDAKEMFGDIWKTALGNIPPFASLVYGLESGELAPTAWFQNINDAVKAMRKSWPRRIVGIAEVLGLPKQVRHTVEGIQAIRKGIKVSGTERIEIKGWQDQIRALINGKWGSLTARKYFVERERKGEWNKDIAKTLSKIKGKHFRAAIKGMTTKTFKQNFWDYVNALSPSDKDKIRGILKTARKGGLKLSFESVLRQLKEMFND